MRLFLGADHRGFALKNQLKVWLTAQSIDFIDFGATEYNAEDDYNDFAKTVAIELQKNPDQNFGILICGSAQGMAMQANRYHNIRAAVCYSSAVATESRSHNDANVACIPADEPAINITTIVQTFISTPALTEAKYQRRNQKLDT